jgi:hypothetical protein
MLFEFMLLVVPVLKLEPLVALGESSPWNSSNVAALGVQSLGKDAVMVPPAAMAMVMFATSRVIAAVLIGRQFSPLVRFGPAIVGRDLWPPAGPVQHSASELPAPDVHSKSCATSSPRFELSDLLHPFRAFPAERPTSTGAGRRPTARRIPFQVRSLPINLEGMSGARDSWLAAGRGLTASRCPLFDPSNGLGDPRTAISALSIPYRRSSGSGSSTRNTMFLACAMGKARRVHCLRCRGPFRPRRSCAGQDEV